MGHLATFDSPTVYGCNQKSFDSRRWISWSTLGGLREFKLDARQRALTTQGQIEIQATLTIPLFASRPRSPPIAAVKSMTSKLVILASWQIHFMTSVLVTNSQCVKVLKKKWFSSKRTLNKSNFPAFGEIDFSTIAASRRYTKANKTPKRKLRREASYLERCKAPYLERHRAPYLEISEIAGSRLDPGPDVCQAFPEIVERVQSSRVTGNKIRNLGTANSFTCELIDHLLQKGDLWLNGIYALNKTL